MRRVEQGESFTVTRNGAPVADLIPHSAPKGTRPARFVAVDRVASEVAALPGWGAIEFAHELRELDHAVDDRDVDPWTTPR